VLTIGFAVAALVAAAVRPAAAQSDVPRRTPSVELSGGLQFLHIPDETYPFGWNVDMSGPVGDHNVVRWVGEFGMAEDHPPITDSLRFYHFGAGVRFMPSDRRHAQPFFQLLGGVARAEAAFPGANSTDVAWGPMVQPGVGLNVPINHFFSLVGQGDYRFAIFRSQTDNEFRVSVGARVMFW
jgi:hypothetical protein